MATEGTFGHHSPTFTVGKKRYDLAQCEPNACRRVELKQAIQGGFEGWAAMDRGDQIRIEIL
jgi:hypothetical protein